MGHKLARITSIHNITATWRKVSKTHNVITIYPLYMSTHSISMICPAIIAESSMIFKASSSLQVAVKPSHGVSKLARGYRDLKILTVRLVDCLMLAINISRDLVGRLSHI
jgi:hypothetical protein